jgi:hypothetical protein
VRSIAEAMFFVTGSRHYIIRFRKGNNIFNQSGLLSTIFPPNFKTDVLPFVYTANIIRNNINYTIATDAPPTSTP